MSMWQRFKKWALRGNPLAEPYEPAHVSMVGEPVVSFIKSLHREAGRRYVISEIDPFEYIGEKYYWMKQPNFYQLLDKKTGSIYQGYIHDNQLYSVVGLPFDLNGWEKAALFDAFLGFRCAARDRLDKMKYNRRVRERAIDRAEALVNRSAYAKRFQENVE